MVQRGAAGLRLVLASGSPQRRAILTQLGVPFDVVVPGVEELAEGDPHAVAEENARRKAQAVPGALVLACDTLVTVDGRILGKPRDAAQAAEYLELLRGRTHQVVGGVAVHHDGELRTATDTTDVTFRAAFDVQEYVQTGEWEGRAGGYAVQGRGALLVRGIRGDHLNVVGLPVGLLADQFPQVFP